MTAVASRLEVRERALAILVRFLRRSERYAIAVTCSKIQTVDYHDQDDVPPPLVGVLEATAGICTRT